MSLCEGVTMKEKSKEKKGEKKKEELEKRESVISEELVRWMTEGTNPNHIPRSDCG
tara:strand:+ start:59 stop:226 length:168 start_codon:yes stop_codon:yes gene_type:complete